MRIGVVSVIVIFILASSFLYTTPNTLAELPEGIENGPFIDRIVYKVISDQDQRFLAIEAGEIEMDSSFIDPYYVNPIHLATLEADPDISISETLRNGYAYVSFDCEQFPTNISAFRRAFAYAFNKSKIVEEIMNGYAQIHDSIVPYQNQFCIEDELDNHYYDSRPDLGNAILDDLGFIINSTTGFREAPNGDQIHILIVFGMGAEKYGRIADVCIEAFTSLNISASSTAPCQCDLHQEMTVWHQQFYDYDLSWLAYQYWSECPDDYYLNTGFSDTGYSNSTFDSWRNQFFNSPTYEDTFEAASEMQKILHYNVPLIPIYQDIQLNPYRNDRFTGHIEDSVNSIYGLWTMLNIRKLDGTFGGTVTVGISGDPNFNFLSGTSGHWLLTNMHCALYTKDPDQLPYPQLAESMEIETHADNPSVTEGNTRFTFEIRNDIEWTDGVPVTSDDVFFTLNYTLYGYSELSAIYSPRPGLVVVEFSTESYWLFDRFAYTFIAPKHITENYELEEWTSLNLITTDDGISLNCGIFTLTDYEEGEFYELTLRYQYSRGDWEERIYLNIASIISNDDIEVEFPVFTVSWDLEWRMISDGYLVDQLGRFNLDAVLVVIPFSYTVLLDGRIHSEGKWNWTDGSMDTITVDFAEPALTVGRHNVTLCFNNNYDSIQVDTVMVTVKFPFSPVTLTIGVSVSIIAIAGIAILWNTKLRRSQSQLSGP